MITNIIPIGNSKGVRIPKPLLNESGLESKVEIRAKKGEIKITSAKTKIRKISANALLSEKSLTSDWNRPEEEKAWQSLQ